ncbi:MAG: enoyl-CoA hydratase/isomerase family protein [Promethearchaeota archaeon]
MNIEDIQDIIYEKEPNGICIATLNIPERKNAMSLVTFLELITILEDMEADKNSRVLIITGKGDAFSSGGFFNLNLLTSIPLNIKDEIDMQDIAQKKISMKLWNFPKPIIGAVNGLAVGAGFTMLLIGADLIYASENAWMGFFFSKRGVIAEFAAHFLLPFYLGFQRAKELLYFGKSLSAQEAYELGIVNKVIPHNELLNYARQQALKLIPPKGPSFSINLMKKTMHHYFKDILEKTLDLENEGIRDCFKTSDFRAALKSLSTKKNPKFKGK